MKLSMPYMIITVLVAAMSPVQGSLRSYSTDMIDSYEQLGFEGEYYNEEEGGEREAQMTAGKEYKHKL